MVSLFRKPHKHWLKIAPKVFMRWLHIKLGAPNAPESYDSILEVGDDMFQVNHKSLNTNKSHYLTIDKVIRVEAP